MFRHVFSRVFVETHFSIKKLPICLKTGWWFQIFFYFHPYLGKISDLTSIYQRGWNHQPENHFLRLRNPFLVILVWKQWIGCEHWWRTRMFYTTWVLHSGIMRRSVGKHVIICRKKGGWNVVGLIDWDILEYSIIYMMLYIVCCMYICLFIICHANK